MCGAMERLARPSGRTLTTISAGGGLPTPYRAGETYVDLAAYFELWDAARKRLEDEFGHKLRSRSSRAATSWPRAATSIAEIRAVKQMGGNTFYLLDAGFNNLARPILYGSYHPMSIVPAQRRRPARTRCPLRDVVVGGPLCESGDIFTQEEGGFVCSRALPAAAASATAW